MKQLLTNTILLILLLAMKPAAGQDSSTVYFHFDSYRLTDEAKQVLDQLVKPNLWSAKIYGHTDQFGSVEYNERLSEQRARAVREYLEKRGVDKSKIKMIQGFGETMPVIDRLDAISRRANRRVVIVTDYEITTKDSIVMEDKSPALVPPVDTSLRRKPPEKLLEKITDTTTKAGDNIVLKNINFYGGRHVFLPESYPALHELLHAMQTIPTLEIEIQGHICCLEHSGDGLDIDTGEPFLSHNRAQAVYEYLVNHGVDGKRMRYRGFGHQYPIIAVEQNEEERTINRRVEIRILKK